MKRYIGIDVGSTNAKIAVLDENKNLIKTEIKKTGFSSKDTANDLLSKVLEGSNKEDANIVATGYGRVSVDGADKVITEITCHARGASYIFNNDNLIIIDIGGQDTKIIELENGQVKNFVMNDKCSAGTGRFLEVMAKTMELSVEELCELAKTGHGVTISSLCTVFAESEIISLIGKSEKKENIANAVVMSIVQKVAGQTRRINFNNKLVCITGGLGDIEFFVKSLSDALGIKIITSPNGKYAGAIGAALLAS